MWRKSEVCVICMDLQFYVLGQMALFVLFEVFAFSQFLSWLPLFVRIEQVRLFLLALWIVETGPRRCRRVLLEPA